jgi:hypothetical protein
MTDEKPFSEPGDLYRQFLYQDEEVVVTHSLKQIAINYLVPVWYVLIFLPTAIVRYERIPSVPLKAVLILGVITFAWAVLVFISESRYPHTVRIGQELLILEWWFRKPKTVVMREIDVFDPPAGSDLYSFIAIDLTFFLRSSMKNFAVLIDRINMSQRDMADGGAEQREVVMPF